MLKEYLTKKLTLAQQEFGLTLEETEDFVTLKHKDYTVATFYASIPGTTEEVIRAVADRYMGKGE